MGRWPERFQQGMKFGERGDVPFKHYAITVVIVYFVFVLMTLHVLVSYLPMMQEVSQALEGMGNEDAMTIHEGSIFELQALLLLSMLAFGIVDDVFAFILWKAQLPIKNENIFTPLYYLYLALRFVGGFIIIELAVFAITGSGPRLYLNLIYLMIAVFSAVSLVIIALIYSNVLSPRDESELLYELPGDAPF